MASHLNTCIAKPNKKQTQPLMIVHFGVSETMKMYEPAILVKQLNSKVNN